MRTISLKTIWNTTKEAVSSWWEKDPFRESAAVAYYAIFSLPGLLVVIITVAGFFWERDVITNHIIDQIGQTMGHGTAEQIKEMLTMAGRSSESWWASIIGVLTIIIGATGVFAELQKALNRVWEVKTVKEKGLWPLVRTRVFSFGLILSIAFLLLISLVVTTLLSAVSNRLAGSLSYIAILFQLVDFLISFGVITVLFALMYKVLPDARIKWRNVWHGAMATALLFIVGKFGLGLYFGTAKPASNYGAASSLILILLWVSYSSIIFFLGAEYTHANAKRQEGYIKPAPYAVSEPEETQR